MLRPGVPYQLQSDSISKTRRTLEMHRNLDIITQIRHLMLSGLIDDITIANAYASEEELKMASEIFFSQNISIRVSVLEGITTVERKCLFESLHAYRGDCSEYMLRSSMKRFQYKGEQFSPHNTLQIKPGHILIDNELYGQYKGEMQIALKEMENDGRVNVIGKVVEEDMILLNYLKPWASFKLIESNERRE
ncbi:phospho-sugar glycosidase domain-containing protein [Novisyntrophococcus fermenticellae]|uniref:phospho-sugar glycosidase domain-containing protein n=1 Tax=Novisyntrophococcus fermenticellae TaxID=2068655 RepID=UPI0022A8300D|nr:phospho-sugar glycosidase domain-containing protein [Novisyntrophococcus fermenticellae]